MPRAWSLIRDAPHYRRDAFSYGLQAAGYAVERGEPGSNGGAGDVLVVWNGYGHVEPIAVAFERRGGRVVVAENGYLGKDYGGVQHYALALGGHNGGGSWASDDGARWRAMGVALRPWRDRGHHILLCPSRGIGPEHNRQKPEWPKDVTARIKQHTQRPVRLRPHPGNQPPLVPLEKDLLDCWACVIWSSNAGTHALIAGIPVFFEGPHWILSPAGLRDIATIDDPALPDRVPAFERLACAQWTVEEIASGEAFGKLLA